MFNRIINLVRGFFTSVLRVFESRNPHALIEAEKINLRNQINKFNEGLTEQAANVYRLTRQAQQVIEEERKLADRVRIHLQAGDQNNASKLALQLSNKRKEAEELRTRCLIAEETLVNLEKARDKTVSDATARLEKLETIVSHTEIVNARNAMLELAGSISLTCSSSDSSLAISSSVIEKSHDLAIGKSRIIDKEVRKLQEEIELHESEQKILEGRALAEFISENAINENIRDHFIHNNQSIILSPESRQAK